VATAALAQHGTALLHVLRAARLKLIHLRSGSRALMID
jgi:hypothetical protein